MATVTNEEYKLQLVTYRRTIENERFKNIINMLSDARTKGFLSKRQQKYLEGVESKLQEWTLSEDKLLIKAVLEVKQ